MVVLLDSNGKTLPLQKVDKSCEYQDIYDTYNATHLKKYLKEIGIKCSGKKRELIQRLMKFVATGEKVVGGRTPKKPPKRQKVGDQAPVTMKDDDNTPPLLSTYMPETYEARSTTTTTRTRHGRPKRRRSSTSRKPKENKQVVDQMTSSTTKDSDVVMQQLVKREEQIRRLHQGFEQTTKLSDLIEKADACSASGQFKRCTNPYLKEAFLGREKAITQLMEFVRKVWQRDFSTEKPIVLDVANVSRAGKTLFGRRALVELQQHKTAAASADHHILVQSVDNGLDIFIDFSNGSDGDWCGGSDLTKCSPQKWIALRLLARGLFGVPTAQLVKALSLHRLDHIFEFSSVDVMDEILKRHRAQKGLNATDPVTVIVHVDEHQRFRDELRDYFKAANVSKPDERARSFICQAVASVARASQTRSDFRNIVMLTGSNFLNPVSLSTLDKDHLYLEFLSPSIVYDYLMDLAKHRSSNTSSTSSNNSSTSSNNSSTSSTSSDARIIALRDLGDFGVLAGLVKDFQTSLDATDFTNFQAFLQRASAARIAKWKEAFHPIDHAFAKKLLFWNVQGQDIFGCHLDHLFQKGCLPITQHLGQYTNYRMLSLPVVIQYALCQCIQSPKDATMDALEQVCRFPGAQPLGDIDAQHFQRMFLAMLVVRLNLVVPKLQNYSSAPVWTRLLAASTIYGQRDALTDVKLNRDVKIEFGLRPTLDEFLSSIKEHPTGVSAKAVLLDHAQSAFDGVLLVPARQNRQVLLLFHIKASNMPNEQYDLSMLTTRETKKYYNKCKKLDLLPFVVVASQQNIKNKDALKSLPCPYAFVDNWRAFASTPTLAHRFIAPHDLD